MNTCTLCQDYGLRFERKYQPVEFIEGHKNSKVWIIGLNPAQDPDWRDEERTVDGLGKHFDDLSNIDRYFKNFKTVSEVVFNGFGKEGGTAHTDIVKCSTRSFSQTIGTGERADFVINNCKVFLEKQLKIYKPKIIICNGVVVSDFMLQFIPPPISYSKGQTSYWSNIDGDEVCVVLSGFIQRIDNYAKRRLGLEIEVRLQEANAPGIASMTPL